MRTTTLLLCLALGAPLAACVTDEGAPPPAAMASAVAEPVTPTPPTPPGRGSPRPPKQQQAAAAPASGSDSKEEWWKEGGVTREKINAMCWMKFEKGRKDLPIDKRADLVNTCVADALKEHPLQ